MGENSETTDEPRISMRRVDSLNLEAGKVSMPNHHGSNVRLYSNPKSLILFNCHKDWIFIFHCMLVLICQLFVSFFIFR